MAIAHHKVGFVYVLTNDLMPGTIKVGLTSWLPEDRAKGLYTTGVPVPFEVAFRATTSRPKDVEHKAHELLRDSRVSGQREFFRVPVDEAIEAVRLAMVEVAGIASWSSSKPYTLRSNDRLALTLGRGQVFALLYYENIFATRAEAIDFWEAKSDGDLLEIFGSKSAKHVAGFSDDDPGGADDPVPYLNRTSTVANGMIYGRERLTPGERLVWLPTQEQSKLQSSVIFEASDYCQIISRTWSPTRGPHGLPRLFNEISHDELWPAAVRAIRDACALPMPRNWAPRANRSADWEDFGSEPLNPEEWLPQLKPRTRN